LTHDRHWLGFLEKALGARRVVALEPSAPCAAGPGAAAGDLLFVPAGARLERLPPGAVAWAAVADDIDDGCACWRAPFRLRPAPGTATGALAVHGPPVAEQVAAQIAAIASDDRARAPGDPLPDEAGRALRALALARRSRRALELGTGDGAGSLWLASALDATGGHLVTIERDSARWTRARAHARRAGLEHVLDARLGEAERLLSRLEGRYDLVVLDAERERRAEHLLAVMPRCRRGALIVSPGAVAHAAALARYQALVRTHVGLAAEHTIAAGHGLGLALLA